MFSRNPFSLEEIVQLPWGRSKGHIHVRMEAGRQHREARQASAFKTSGYLVQERHSGVLHQPQGGMLLIFFWAFLFFLRLLEETHRNLELKKIHGLNSRYRKHLPYNGEN